MWNFTNGGRLRAIVDDNLGLLKPCACVLPHLWLAAKGVVLPASQLFILLGIEVGWLSLL